MRTLKFTDAFKVSRILGKMKIRVEFVEAMTQDQMGIALIQGIMENLHEAEKEVVDLLADMKGVSKKEIENLPFDEVVELIEEFKNMPELKSFFTSVSKLMK